MTRSATPTSHRSAAERASAAEQARQYRALARQYATAGVPWASDAARAEARRTVEAAPPKEGMR